jgi:hypothetical protein
VNGRELDGLRQKASKKTNGSQKKESVVFVRQKSEKLLGKYNSITGKLSKARHNIFTRNLQV